ncbi:MAG: 4a-hydroxytetrahydrobiopterin dehydratase, partial [Burkholderiales bacterium]|nr:4a-hydroxytetrahydrobiopterin dehydratase [Burkholderiales bacterium]
QDHHPEMHVSYDACTVSYTTHARGGLTLNDAICAAQVSALPEATGT